MIQAAGEKMLDVFLNYACQAKCPFCFNPPLTGELIRWRLPLERLAEQLLRERRAGFTAATYSGGEVTLLRELPKMIRLAKAAGYAKVGIVSNGLRLAEPNYAAELARAGLSFCCISLHAADAALHDELLVRPGAFEAVLKATALLEGHGIPVMLNYVLTRRNLAELVPFVKKFAHWSGVAGFQVYFPHYDGMMERNAVALGLRLDEAAPWARRALAAARRLGAADRLWFFNFPPCALPESVDRLCEWGVESESLLVDPKGLAGDGFAQERRGRVKSAACGSCRLDARCLGLEQSYARLFGLSEIRPLSSRAKAAASGQSGTTRNARSASSRAAAGSPSPARARARNR